MYRPNSQMGRNPIMHARCEACGDRTWFTSDQWEDLVVTPNVSVIGRVPPNAAVHRRGHEDK